VQLQIGVPVFDRPRLRTLNLDGIVGGGVPAGIPRQRPPWFSSDAQYEAFLQMTARDLGPQCITATSIDVAHLDEPARKELLSAQHCAPPWSSCAPPSLVSTTRHSSRV
jgi:hypothetical protein